MITITSKVDGFRRCGIAHAARPVCYPDDRFSEAEFAALLTDPMLVVTVDDTVELSGDGSGKGLPPVENSENEQESAGKKGKASSSTKGK